MKIKDIQNNNYKNPFVSISCITYNQENYIANTIEYFLNQNVDFHVEILIHDDASTDNTQNIIKEYTAKYPHIIKPVLQKENQFSKGARCIHATYNFNRSKGKYVGTCEGDDYWIDPNKLRKQVEFLEANKDFSLCSHEVYFTSFKYPKDFKSMSNILFKNFKYNGFIHFTNILKLLITNNEEFWNRRRISGSRPRTADLQDLLKSYHKHIYIPTVSILGRGEIFRKMPKDILLTPSGHKEHIFWSALHGNVKHLKDVMGQRNQQANSLTITKLHGFNQKTIEERISHFEDFYSRLSRYANNNQREMIKNAIHDIKSYYRTV